MSIALLIADDHELVRAGLRETFAGTNVDVVAEAATPAQARRLARDKPVDVVLLDIGWARQDGGPDGFGLGFDLLQDMRRARADTPVLIYSIYERSEYIDRCRRFGASGYLVKGSDDRLLVAAVHAVYDGGQMWPDGCRQPPVWAAAEPTR
jgi:DNA-binding NarL/FixJ family response regulator